MKLKRKEKLKKKRKKKRYNIKFMIHGIGEYTNLHSEKFNYISSSIIQFIMIAILKACMHNKSEDKRSCILRHKKCQIQMIR